MARIRFSWRTRSAPVAPLIRGRFLGARCSARVPLCASRDRRASHSSWYERKAIAELPTPLVVAPPSIAIEVVSETECDERRDRIEKMKEYAAAGIRYYWLVDPGIRSFEVLELIEGGRYAISVSAAEGVVDGVPGCAGLRLDISGLWAEIDELLAGDTRSSFPTD